MSSRMPPRYLPTLTEVVYPKAKDPEMEAAEQKLEPAFEPPREYKPAAYPEPEIATAAVHAEPAFNPATAPVAPDRHALAQQLIKLVQPQLEAELRNIAMQLFEAQFSALLPSLQMHIEEAVREALDQALPPQQPDRKD